VKGPVVFLDLETGGLAPHHAEIQVAAIAVADWKELDIFERKIQFDPAKQAEAEALALNSYDAEAWAHLAVPEAQVVGELGSWLRPFAAIRMLSQRGKPYVVVRLAGHNALGFDCPRLAAMFKRHQAFLPAAIYHPLDTMQLALWRCAAAGETPADYRLVTLCRHFGVPLTDAHDALSDVRATIALAKRLLTEAA